MHVVPEIKCFMKKNISLVLACPVEALEMKRKNIRRAAHREILGGSEMFVTIIAAIRIDAIQRIMLCEQRESLVKRVHMGDLEAQIEERFTGNARVLAATTEHSALQQVPEVSMNVGKVLSLPACRRGAPAT